MNASSKLVGAMILAYTDTIMANHRKMQNRVKVLRQERGWAQAQLAERAAISRAAVSAIEMHRLTPSVEAALALAGAFDCSVEELFGLSTSSGPARAWAWSGAMEPCRYWHARLGDRTLLYPVEATPLGVSEHDGVFRDGRLVTKGHITPEETLIMACCDPAASLLAREYSRSSGFRLLVFPRSSQEALTLLGRGVIHVAGVHLSTADYGSGNANSVKARLSGGFNLLRAGRWQEGLALGPGVSVRSVRSALRADLRWVGRESGSAARQCLDELLANRPAPRRLARDHRGVAEAVRCGWADIGVCLQLVSEEAGLRFLDVREEAYDLCYAASAEADPRIRALLRVIRSAAYRALLDDLPGYESSGAGEVVSVN